MATFPPFAAHILAAVDDLVVQHGLAGPFLDAGCGDGHAAVHLARRGWAGVALDAAPAAAALAREALRPYPAVAAVPGELGSYRGGPFATVLLLDVLEHVADDEAALRAAAALQESGGALVLVVPTNPHREWRWDDDVYGHLRRYEPARLAGLLAGAGYDLLETWDVTWPVFWLLRRAYTALKRSPRLVGTPWDRTLASATARAWDLGPVSTALGHPAAWRPLLALQRRFRHRVDAGHEAIALARRRRDPGA